MNWRAVRLELASNSAFPGGSASRAYILHVPLHDDGHVDFDGLDQHPERAGVRRFWPNEADRSGQLVAMSGRLGIRFEDRDGDLLEAVHLIDGARVVAGEVLTLHVDDAPLPFKVVSVKQL